LGTTGEADREETCRVLVTGSSGFLGRHVLCGLAALPRSSVHGFDLRAAPDPGWVAWQGDLTDDAAVTTACEGVDVVVHFGGVGDVDLATADPGLAARANVVGTTNVALAASRVGAKVVYASTWEVYGPPLAEEIDETHPCNPNHVYGATKLAGEQVLRAIARSAGVPVVVLRLGTAYGPGMRENSVFRRFADAARAGKPLVVHGDGRQFRQFTHTSDIVRAVVLAKDLDEPEITVNVVAEETVTIADLAATVAARYGAAIVHAPSRPGDPHPARVSAQAAARVLRWKAEMGFAEGLTRLLADFDAERGASSLP
jgi:UDP-glucose 4-epimerase